MTPIEARSGTRYDNEVRSFLVDLQGVLRQVVTGLEPEAATYLETMVMHGGHGFRPRLLREAALARSVGVEAGRVLHLAACVELLHVASLVHDDYADRSPYRRDVPTPRSSLGSEATLLLGTAAAVEAVKLARDLGYGFARALIDGATRLAEGQLADAQRSFADLTQISEYVELQRRKTGSLMALTLLLGAAAALPLTGRDVRTLTCLGEDLGVAFQIADDLDDECGRTDGKPAGLDESNGVGIRNVAMSDGMPATVDLLRSVGLRHLDAAVAAWCSFFGKPPSHDGALATVRRRLGAAA